jgi:hypothetical protein
VLPFSLPSPFLSAPAPQTTNHGEGNVELDTHQKTQEQEIRDAHSQRFEEGTEHAHSLIDSKDERSLANNIAAAQKAEKEQEIEDNKPAPLPTAAAEAHGNKPSKGATIDEQIMIGSSFPLFKFPYHLA